MHQHQRASIACSICGATFASCGAAENASASQQHHRTTASAYGTTMALARVGLESSFVNIPRSYQPKIASENYYESGQCIHDIESILDHALRLSSNKKGVTFTGTGSSIMQNSTGANMHEASRRMDAFLESTMSILSGGSNNNVMEGKDEQHRSYYCRSCLGMISQAVDSCSEQFDEECVAFEKAASSEEERVFLMLNVLSANTDIRGLPLSDIDRQHEDDTIHHAIELFQSELDALSNACNEQQKELRILQNLMQTQIDRSKSISDLEDIVHHELNSLELEAKNFEEESHLVINRCNAVENEIAAISSVKLFSIPFKIRLKDDGNDSISNGAGRYPTINSLRLAYRINTKAGLTKKEINAAFFHAAQLVAFTLGLHPSLNTTVIRIIPIHPCAKVLVNLPEGQTIHNLGVDTNSGGTARSNHVPTQSLTLFLALLSEATSYILTERKQRNDIEEPPFPMKELSIDNVEVTKLADSNTAAWSSVVFCIAANLRWLSELEM